jgi:CheY-like chemotaxis protein
MLVEDDNNLREIYEARLAAEGYDIVAAENGEDALALAAKEHPDMIISDVMMPKISGFEMLDILRNTESLKNVKIIMLTALGQAEDSARANALGADRYLVKSQVTLEDIVKATHDLLDPPANPLAEALLNTQPNTETAETTEPTPQQTSMNDASEAVVTSQPPAFAAPTPEVPTEPMSPPALEVAPTPEIAVAEPYTPDVPVQSQTQTISIPVADGNTDDTSATAPQPSADTTDTSDDQPAILTLPPLQDETADQSGTDLSVEASAVQNEETTAEPEPKPETDEPVLPEITLEPSEASSETEDTAPVSEQQESTNDPEPTPVEDYTSPETFNKFQVPSSIPSVADSVSQAAPQSTADEEASIKAQIDSFIAQTDTVEPAPTSDSELQNETTPEPETVAAVPTPTPNESFQAVSEPVTTEPASFASAPPAPEEPVPSIPALAPVSYDTTGTGNADELPGAESIEAYSAPLISSVAPGSVGETNNSETEFVQAAQNLAEANTVDENGVHQPPADEAEQPAARDENGQLKKKIITPLPSTPKPSLEQLLQLEDAKVAAQQTAYQQPNAPRPNVGAYNPGANLPPQQPNNQSSVDPNSISL